MPKREVIATSVTVTEKLYGYNGRVLRVNLSNGKVDSESISEKFCRKYLGGAGFIAYYLWKELKVDLLKAVTGWDTGIYELLRIGERILTLMRLINQREGLDAAYDILPERFFQPKTDGVVSNVYIDRERYNKAKKFYYALMGWDANGVPLPEKAEELGIE